MARISPSVSVRVTAFDCSTRFREIHYVLHPNLQKTPMSRSSRVTCLDRQALRAAVEGVSAVIHCAAIAGVSNYYDRPVETLRVNILGTVNLLDAMVDAGVNRLIYFSTSEIYGPQAESVTESAAPTSGPVFDRRWTYSVSKLAGEHLTLRYGEVYGINTTVIRPFNIYGPRQTGEGAISNFARKLVRGEPLEVYGDGSDVRAWCYVSDLVNAVDLALERPAAYGGVFNIGNPAARVTTVELAEAMIAANGGGEITTLPRSHSPIPMRTPDISSAQAVLGFEPKVGLEQGLRDTLEWFKTEQQ